MISGADMALVDGTFVANPTGVDFSNTLVAGCEGSAVTVLIISLPDRQLYARLPQPPKRSDLQPVKMLVWVLYPLRRTFTS